LVTIGILNIKTTFLAQILKNSSAQFFINLNFLDDENYYTSNANFTSCPPNADIRTAK
jgi:hypothetical protein